MSNSPRDHAEGSEASSDRPSKRLKITFKQERPQDDFAIKREDSVDEVLPSPNNRMSRSGRAIKAPTAYVPSPVAAPGKRQKSTPRKRLVNIICAKCDRGTSPKSNPIVFCSGCESTWHQKCHDPEIPDDAIVDEDKEWHCHRCVRPRRSTGTRPIKPQESNTPIQQRGQFELGGAVMNVEERRAYFASLPYAQLVDLLVDISSKSPDIKIFPAAMALQKPFSPVPASPKLKGEDEEGYRKHPRAGNGFALSQDPAELDILKENPASQTFSHVLNVSEASTPKRVWHQVTTFGKYLLG